VPTPDPDAETPDQVTLAGRGNCNKEPVMTLASPPQIFNAPGARWVARRFDLPMPWASVIARLAGIGGGHE